MYFTILRIKELEYNPYLQVPYKLENAVQFYTALWYNKCFMNFIFQQERYLLQSIPRLQKIFANYRKTDLLFETGFVACQNQFQIEDKLIQSPKRVGHPGCRSYFGTVRPDCAGRLPTNIFYLKTVLANTKGTNLVDHPTEYLLFEKLFVVQSYVENLGSIQLISSI